MNGTAYWQASICITYNIENQFYKALCIYFRAKYREVGGLLSVRCRWRTLAKRNGGTSDVSAEVGDLSALSPSNRYFFLCATR